MKVPKRYLKKNPSIFKVVGLSFKPRTTIMGMEKDTKIGFKIGDWDEPIDFIPFFQTSENYTPQIH
ncbi:hypothetical protein EHV15_35405 [Paenibacillus oralis]|uniref:Uncharacterized protein n=1 Tax=Paenibacillus oralis TaxID=2490856 RepID=A0A3P3TEL5_9BACL|nr:hypothetical protein [Paenibacillus oralis]RRJ54863.1 hypothetical protein EHV15_35405 [Paenibacillus oralis]